MSAWGDIKYSCHRYLPGGGGLLCSCQKRLCKIKCGFDSSISNVDLGLPQPKKTINV